MITEAQKTAYKEYLKSKEWYELKAFIVSKRGLKCEKCNTEKSDSRGLHLHHLTYVRLFNELPQDLMLLCSICHMKEHGLIKEVKPKAKKKIKHDHKKPKRGVAGRHQKSDDLLKRYRAGEISYVKYTKDAIKIWQPKKVMKNR